MQELSMEGTRSEIVLASTVVDRGKKYSHCVFQWTPT
jgi:hypothetical protein